MRTLSIALMMAVCASATVARAQQPQATDPEAAKARSLYDQGMARFQLEEYAQAISKWEEGFRIKPVPEFLYNIAQAYRLSKQSDKALSFYKKFLHMKPDAANREEVERHIRELSAVVNAQERTSTAPPTGPITPGSAATTTPEPAPTAAEPAATTATPAPQSSTQAELARGAPEKKPLTKKPWFWAVVGGGAAVVVVAVVVGVVVGTRGNSPNTLPMLRF
jgi:tetratricopeptide (TPR) repeat protein